MLISFVWQLFQTAVTFKSVVANILFQRWKQTLIEWRQISRGIITSSVGPSVTKFCVLPPYNEKRRTNSRIPYYFENCPMDFCLTELPKTRMEDPSLNTSAVPVDGVLVTHASNGGTPTVWALVKF